MTATGMNGPDGSSSEAGSATSMERSYSDCIETRRRASLLRSSTPSVVPSSSMVIDASSSALICTVGSRRRTRRAGCAPMPTTISGWTFTPDTLPGELAVWAE
jgi:hypothetical protein